MAKLYSNMSRFAVRSYFRKSRFKKLQWGLALKVGDLVNDCTGFNAKITSIKPEIILFRRGWLIGDFSLTTAPYNNFCSLMNCCTSPESREKIEREEYEWLQHYFPNEFERYMAGSSKEITSRYHIYYSKLLSALTNGQHICDEDGCLLEEFIFPR